MLEVHITLSRPFYFPLAITKVSKDRHVISTGWLKFSVIVQSFIGYFVAFLCKERLFRTAK